MIHDFWKWVLGSDRTLMDDDPRTISRRLVRESHIRVRRANSMIARNELQRGQAISVARILLESKHTQEG